MSFTLGSLTMTWEQSAPVGLCTADRSYDEDACHPAYCSGCSCPTGKKAEAGHVVRTTACLLEAALKRCVLLDMLPVLCLCDRQTIAEVNVVEGQSFSLQLLVKAFGRMPHAISCLAGMLHGCLAGMQHAIITARTLEQLEA